MIPRPVVVFVVLVLLGLLIADIGGQYVIPGHTASPVIDGAMIALLGSIIVGTKGPKPEAPATSPEVPVTAPLDPPPSDPPTETGRHRGSST